MQNAHDQNDPQQDHDSFLDIVANIVGILIILVMVVSLRARQAPPAPTPDPAKEAATEKANIDHQALQQDVARLILEHQQLADYLSVRQEERHRLTVALAYCEQKMSERRNQLAAHDRQAHEIESQIAVLQTSLDSLRLEHIEAASREADVKEIQHLPTPIGHSVFGRELHFQLLGGRVTHLPIQALFSEARSQARQKVWKLDQLPEATETVGPQEGFHMRYTLEKIPLPREVQMETGRTGFMIRSKLWELIPTSTRLGEPLETALAEQSTFRSYLRGLDPETTTITLWTYPDSFMTYRTLKRELHTLGFAAAARPLPSGVRIAGSPSGSRSTAQ